MLEMLRERFTSEAYIGEHCAFRIEGVGATLNISGKASLRTMQTESNAIDFRHPFEKQLWPTMFGHCMFIHVQNMSINMSY
jgi:hypothetical protein